VILQPGQRLADRYTLGDRIAVGGMGEVWSGMDDVLSRPVAVKALRQDLSADRAFQARFREEARTAGGLSHGGIAAVYDYGEDGRLCYLVMELVEGEPLSAMLARNGALDVDLALDLIAQTARALHAAHLRGVVHRDVKPANLLVTPDLRVKVTDFGIARPRDHEPLTATGQVMGTAHYLAPELARGEVASPLSDVYALGIVAYECLAGRRPFEGDNQIAVATAQLMEQPPPLPASIPVPVRRVVEAALAKRPQERPAGAQAFAVLLEDLYRARKAHGAGRGALPQQPGGPGRLPKGELPDVAPVPAGTLGAAPARDVEAVAGAGHTGAAAGTGLADGAAPTSRRASLDASRPASRQAAAGRQTARRPERDPMGPPTPVLPLAVGGTGWSDRLGLAGAGRFGTRLLRQPLPMLALLGLVVAAILGATLTGGDDPSTRTPGSTLPTPTTTASSPKPAGSRSATSTSTRTSPSASSSSQSASTSSTGPTGATVQIRAKDYLGKDFRQAKRQLEALGMKVAVKRVLRPKLPKDRVVGIEPGGSVVQGSTVTLQVSEKRGGG
jgi:eukaryotic-like serine/threonine-protein kinase